LLKCEQARFDLRHFVRQKVADLPRRARTALGAILEFFHLPPQRLQLDAYFLSRRYRLGQLAPPIILRLAHARIEPLQTPGQFSALLGSIALKRRDISPQGLDFPLRHHTPGHRGDTKQIDPEE
jgi:hypothetical protein